ncbi:electron transfer flavoprotein [Dehalobacterium formicoaceticum]|uniref:Electron transfer flavoprotein small subunit n=1 Tax=Dehalobacterium formicoaceticum TaxID=51515 RepID=A0ABT1Y7T8_9FIRM|nr:electron transfer flavoprotein [Dehalobacterium formicoaceticum]
MKIITCYKIVPEEQDIVVKDDRTLSFDRAEWKIGQYDLNAVEAGMKLAEATGGSASALSIGGKELENSKLKKGILSRGPKELFIIADDYLREADTFQTASALAAAIKKMGSFDLVLCGEGSSDLYAQQVGSQLGQLLGATTLNAVSKIIPEGNKLVVERTLEDEVEVLEVTLPAVLSVTTDINLPRIPGMKDILAAGKKPVTQWCLADIGTENIDCPTRSISTLAPEQTERKQIILEGEEAVQKLYDAVFK